MSKVKVDAIKITIGRKTLELTPDELRELRQVLNRAFGAIPSAQPIIIERPIYRDPWPYRHWDKPVWCGDSPDGKATLSLTCRGDTLVRDGV